MQLRKSRVKLFLLCSCVWFTNSGWKTLPVFALFVLDWGLSNWHKLWQIEQNLCENVVSTKPLWNLFSNLLRIHSSLKGKSSFLNVKEGLGRCCKIVNFVLTNKGLECWKFGSNWCVFEHGLLKNFQHIQATAKLRLTRPKACLHGPFQGTCASVKTALIWRPLLTPQVL